LAFCTKCGAELPEGALYCVKCGTPVHPVAVTPPLPPHAHEKSEKAEKEEKAEKHEKDTTSGALVGGLILIALGATFFASQYGYLGPSRWWALFIVLLGAIVMVQDLYYIGRGRKRGAGVIGGLVLMAIGYSLYVDVRSLWPLILIAIGVGIIANAILARSRSPSPGP